MYPITIVPQRIVLVLRWIQIFRYFQLKFLLYFYKLIIFILENGKGVAAQSDRNAQNSWLWCDYSSWPWKPDCGYPKNIRCFVDDHESANKAASMRFLERRESDVFQVHNGSCQYGWLKTFFLKVKSFCQFGCFRSAKIKSPNLKFPGQTSP